MHGVKECGLDHNASVELSFIRLPCCLVSEQETVSLKAPGAGIVLINGFSSAPCFLCYC